MKLWRLLLSIELCLVLLALVCLLMAVGSFGLSGEYGAAINAVPLFVWLKNVPPASSWWLWLTLVLLGLLVVNTLFCSVQTLKERWGRGRLLMLWAPQLVHAGFLLIVAAHLLSALGGEHSSVEVGEMKVARLPDGSRFGVAAISVTTAPNGMPVGFACDIVPEVNSPAVRVTVSPNHPWFQGGYGVYLKQAEAYPVKRALLEIHREPGAGMALAGGVLFTVGSVLVLALRSRLREE